MSTWQEGQVRHEGAHLDTPHWASKNYFKGGEMSVHGHGEPVVSLRARGLQGSLGAIKSVSAL